MFKHRDCEQVNLVHKNANTGSTQIQAFKDIIRHAIYPKDLARFSPGSMALAERTFNACQKNNCSREELIDLMLFYVECGSQLTIDYGDMDEDFYVALETIFEEVLKLIKEAGHSALSMYGNRLRAIARETAELGWGYGDQISDLIDLEFPGFSKNSCSYETTVNEQ